MSSITEMPELVMEKIIEFSDFKAVLTLRQVCRDFRNFIDDLNDSKLPDSKFTKIQILSEKKDNKIILDFMNSDDSSHRLEYSEIGNSRSFNRKTTLLGNADIVDVAIPDLELILKFQKSTLEFLYFTFDDFQLQNDSSLHVLPIKLSNMLNVSGRKIKTRYFNIKTSDNSQIMSVLPIAEPETLQVLNLLSIDDDEQRSNLHSSYDDGVREIELDEIVKTEQWKNAERMNCYLRVLNLKVEYVSHFPRLFMKIPSITARDLDFLKTTYISSPQFKYAFFELIDFNEHDDISNLWGPAFDSGYSKHFWYFRRKNAEEKILRVEFSLYYRTFSYRTSELEDVLPGAVVQDYNEG
ncbi:hypothetical protein B9Z55_021226 [Caenorhabditis nigoni]|uniref:F-box domain-containing protein n=1 Tax=Caenorhabditis nigoni TaxID=1611254 RepID=A0A2G5TQZ3_9PELO|nr:hypothetical protein B9Z55_021226 [Caenorhabditis nigoni]